MKNHKICFIGNNEKLFMQIKKQFNLFEVENVNDKTPNLMVEQILSNSTYIILENLICSSIETEIYGKLEKYGLNNQIVFSAIKFIKQANFLIDFCSIVKRVCSSAKIVVLGDNIGLTLGLLYLANENIFAYGLNETTLKTKLYLANCFNFSYEKLNANVVGVPSFSIVNSLRTDCENLLSNFNHQFLNPIKGEFYKEFKSIPVCENSSLKYLFGENYYENLKEESVAINEFIASVLFKQFNCFYFGDETVESLIFPNKVQVDLVSQNLIVETNCKISNGKFITTFGGSLKLEILAKCLEILAKENALIKGVIKNEKQAVFSAFYKYVCNKIDKTEAKKLFDSLKLWQ